MNHSPQPLPLIGPEDFLRRAGAARRPFHSQYYAMYSSILGGIVTDPSLMVIPADDHMAHRGDGVFETFKCVGGNIYNLGAHLDRLLASAQGIGGLRLPCGRGEAVDIVVQTARAGDHPDCLIRLFLSRGPGSLGISPYDCPEPALYVAVYALKPPFMQAHPGGARVRRSSIAVKPAPFANIKSVNYLSNVLMKKEAADIGVDFVVTFDERCFLAEGATENFGILSPDRVLKVPEPRMILAGTTMLRVLELARSLAASGDLAGIRQTNIPEGDVARAAEMFIFGTTPDVAAVVDFDGKPIGDGRPGPVFQRLSRMLTDDILHNKALHTPVF